MSRLEWRITINGTARTFAEMPKGAKVIAIDDREVLYECEGCDELIFEGDKYHAWHDGVVTCAKCSGPPKRTKAAKGKR